LASRSSAICFSDTQDPTSEVIYCVGKATTLRAGTDKRQDEDMDHETRLKLFDAVRTSQGSFLETILWRLTGNRELFVEALQESLLQIWRHLEKLEGYGGRAYICRIAQSAAAHAWRTRAGPGGESMENREGPANRPDERAIANESTTILRRAISELPEQQSRAITMRYLEQMDYDAMAREMECSEATLRSHVSKALATLRDALRPADRDVREV
jgi:RNA polymerase sigma-70 factor, ECF subfamily